MILVDTSILIGYFRGISGSKYDLFDRMLETGDLFGICPFVYQEILQGAKDEREFFALKEFLLSSPMFDLRDGLLSYEKAAMLNRRCRKSGVTVRSTIDLLIAETAIENNLELFCNDADYVNMSKVIKELILYDEAHTV